MTEFQVGVRVRVRSITAKVGLAGRVGAIIAVNHNRGGRAVSYVVRIDRDRTKPDTLAHAFFTPHELDPETGSTP